ncbi:hypothetical protein LCGC14_2121490, partial [marine sediment metagenome]
MKTCTAIILAHYKQREGNLKRIVDDLFAGSVVPNEICIFIDNGEIEFKDSRITIIRTDENFLPKIRFVLGSYFDTDYCFFIDDDLTVRKNTLKNLVDNANEKSIIGLQGSILGDTPNPYADDTSIKREKRNESLPSIIGAKNLLPYVDDELKKLAEPIHYYSDSGTLKAGYSALLIPAVCDVYLRASDEPNVIVESQKKTVAQANIIIRALAKVGITALVDEATGYQEDRARDALEAILRNFISTELLKWVKTFPDEFYRQMFRLRNWQYSQFSAKRPSVAGRITNDIIYE